MKGRGAQREKEDTEDGARGNKRSITPMINSTFISRIHDGFDDCFIQHLLHFHLVTRVDMKGLLLFCEVRGKDAGRLVRSIMYMHILDVLK